MATQIHARNRRPPAPAASPRHLWLAALGLMVAARRDSRALLRRGLARVRRQPVR
jgi:hypothetical protein